MHSLSLYRRVQYANMSNNPHIIGPKHRTANTDEKRRCSNLYQHNETFRELFREASPHFRALERLFHVGLEVNRFQKEELRQCVSENQR
jgi:hypothetical protein